MYTFSTGFRVDYLATNSKKKKFPRKIFDEVFSDFLRRAYFFSPDGNQRLLEENDKTVVVVSSSKKNHNTRVTYTYNTIRNRHLRIYT